MTRTFTWNATADSDDAVKIRVDGKGVLAEVGVAFNTLPEVEGKYAARTLSDGTKDWKNVTNNVASTEDGASFETGYYKVTFTYSTSTVEEDYGTSDDGIVYMKPGETIQLTITGDWSTGSPVDNVNGFTVSNAKKNGKTSITVDVTAPTTLDDNESVPFTWIAD